MAELTSALKRFLKQTNAKWSEEATRAKEESGFERVDDGRYIMRVTGADLIESKSSSRPMVVTDLVVLEGDNAGATVKKYRPLDGDDGLFWFGKDMMVFGYDPEDVHFDEKRSDDDGFVLNVLEDLAEEKPVCKVVLKTRNDYQAVNIESIIDDYEIDESEEEEKTPPKKEEKKIPAKKETVKPEPPAKDKTTTIKKKAPEPEPEEEVEEIEEVEEELEEVEEDVEIEVGMKVSFTWNGEELEGVVREILEDENKIKIKVGNKIYPVKGDDETLSILDGDTD